MKNIGKMSKALQDRAKKVLPMGVNSNFRYWGDNITPYMEKAKGAYRWDVDGNKYIDYCMCYAAMVAGHADPVIAEAICEQTKKGILYGMPAEPATELAEEIHKRYPVIDMMEEQKAIQDKGGTMRLGAYPCCVRPGSLAARVYGCEHIHERHRHRYEFNRLYEPLLAWSLANARKVIVAALALLAATVAAFLLLGKAFMPTMDEGDILLQLAKLPSISLERSAETDLAVQRALLEQVPEIKDIIARTGSDELGLDPMGLNETDSFLVLAPRQEWRQPDKEWLTGEIRKVMAGFAGMDIAFTQPIEMRVSEMLTGTRGDLAIKIFGPDLGELNALAEKIAALLRTLRGARDVLTVKNEGVQYYTVEVDRLAAGRFGLSVEEIAASLRAQIEGQPVGLVLEGNRRTPLMIKGGEGMRNSPALFAGMQLALPDGGNVPLSALAQLRRVAGPVKIDHENANRMAVVQANVSGRDLVGFVEEAKAKVAAETKLGEGVHLAWGGQFENQQRAAKRLMLVVPVALALIFHILFTTFGSVRQAAMVFVNIPFALIGGVFALLLAGEYLSVPASVGFIALLGIAVLNGVVMISYFNELRAQGGPPGVGAAPRTSAERDPWDPAPRPPAG